MPQGLGEMEILAKAVAQQQARLMVEPVDQPGCLFADQGRGEREIELLYDDEAAHRGAKLGIERAQYLRPIVDGESIGPASRSEEHTTELQSLMRNSYAVFCLKKKKH